MVKGMLVETWVEEFEETARDFQKFILAGGTIKGIRSC